MNKTKIDWCDYTWNPIKGLCPVGCWYCYARKIYKRFGLDQDPRLDASEMCNMQNTGLVNKRIFVCSTFDLFHPVADKWRESILETIKYCKRNTFIILTKMPENIDRPMPENVWLGVSVSGKDGDDDRIRHLCLDDYSARVKFVSFEPLFGDVAVWHWNSFPDYTADLSWVVVGRLTGYGHRFDPTQANIKRIYQKCRNAGIPIFLKNNLREIWGRSLVQEFPMEMCT